MRVGLYAHVGKRVVDVALSVVALAALSPLLLLVAAAIRAGDGGPALFRQRRIGRGGEPFTLLKFRSMAVGTADRPSAEAGGLRVTRVGAVIRRTNIDELPQLINVLRGEMSLVGPRPALPAQAELVRLRALSGAQACRPGLTGLAQVSAFDGMSAEEKAAFDARYAEDLTLAMDIVIMGRTLGYLTRRPPVY